jgi:hypothetical protein
MPISGLVEYFSKPSAGSPLFMAAIQLEREAFKKNLKPLSGIEELEAKSLLGLITNFSGIPRREILGDKSMKVNNPMKAEEASTIKAQKDFGL